MALSSLAEHIAETQLERGARGYITPFIFPQPASKPASTGSLFYDTPQARRASTNLFERLMPKLTLKDRIDLNVIVTKTPRVVFQAVTPRRAVIVEIRKRRTGLPIYF